MSIKAGARRAAWLAGYDINRRSNSFTGRRLHLMERRGVTAAIDVGANRGQAATQLRASGFKGKIDSFEPLSAEFKRLQQASLRDPRWSVHNVAVGAERTTVTMHVAGNNGASSSVLPMLEAHSHAAPHADFIGTQDVEQITLDSLLDRWADEQVHLKIDVQGYERWVLEGAEAVLARVQTAEIELSFVPIYENGMLFSEARERMQRAGLELAWLTPIFWDDDRDMLLCADGLFARPIG